MVPGFICKTSAPDDNKNWNIVWVLNECYKTFESDAVTAKQFIQTHSRGTYFDKLCWHP